MPSSGRILTEVIVKSAVTEEPTNGLITDANINTTIGAHAQRIRIAHTQAHTSGNNLLGQFFTAFAAYTHKYGNSHNNYEP